MESVIVYKPKQTFQHTCKHCGVAYYNSKPEGETSYCSFPCLLSSLHGKPMDVEKRMLKDIDLPKDLRIDTIPNYVLEQINKNVWEYKGSKRGCSPEYYHIRDRAMMSIAFLACGRIMHARMHEKREHYYEVFQDRMDSM